MTFEYFEGTHSQELKELTPNITATGLLIIPEMFS